VFKVESGRLPISLKQYIESISPAPFAQELLKVNWAHVSTERCEEPFSGSDLETKLKEFMSTTEFETIHKAIWEDVEFHDLVGYIESANYAGLYAAIEQFYKEMGRDDLDVKPPGSTLTQTARNVANLPKATSTNFPIIRMKSSIFKADDPKCDIMYLLGVLDTLNKSNIHEIIKIFLYAFQEFIGNGAVHVLAMKIGEPLKGQFFNNTLALPEMEEFLPLVQGVVLMRPGICQLNEILRQVTGLDVGNMDLFKYIVHLVQYLVWNYPFPAA